MRYGILFFGFLFVLLPMDALARFTRRPGNVPIERLEANVEGFLASHPDDANAHYVLGRLFCIAYVQRGDAIRLWPGSDAALPSFQDPQPGVALQTPSLLREVVRIAFDADPDKDLPEEGRKRIEEVLQKAGVDWTVPSVRAGALCLRKAVQRYQRALELDPKFTLAQLGIAWCYDELGRNEECIHGYWTAYDTALQADLERKDWSRYEGSWHGSVAVDSGTRLLELLRDWTDEGTRTRLADVRKNLEVLKAKIAAGSRHITPILVPFMAVDSLASLLAPERNVQFDLRGDGSTDLWPWVRPEAGFLVWDPDRDGKITSGLQLFGHITWYIPFRNGYEPLALLDDNRDGWIRGAERGGLAIWRDVNQDGISQPGEVVPVEEAGIEELGTRWDEGPDGARCQDGVRFADGTWRPTFDWFPQAAKRP